MSLRPILSESLFSIEFTGIPECLTKDRQMYHVSKSQILVIYDQSPSKTKTIEQDACAIDFSVVVRAQASVLSAKTFDDFYCEIIHHLVNLSAGCSRIDVVTDSYFESSLKAHTRDKRGSGQYFHFSGETLLPKDFSDNFLNNCKNKELLNRFLSERLLLHEFGDVILIVTINNEILRNISHSKESVVSQLKFGCRHEEADVKIVLYIFNCIHLGYQNILVKTGDTDIITLIMAHLHFFKEPYYIEVDFSFSKNRRFYDINKIAAQMTSE